MLGPICLANIFDPIVKDHSVTPSVTILLYGNVIKVSTPSASIWKNYNFDHISVKENIDRLGKILFLHTFIAILTIIRDTYNKI